MFCPRSDKSLELNAFFQGVLGGLVAQPSFLEAIGNPSSSFLGLIVALYNIGCLAGCIVAAMFGNKLGRKRSVFWGCVIMVIGGTIQASTYGSAQLIAGRLVSGVGTGRSWSPSPFNSVLTLQGMITSTIPVYVAECSPAKNRGRSVARQMSIVIVSGLIKALHTWKLANRSSLAQLLRTGLTTVPLST